MSQARPERRRRRPSRPSPSRGGINHFIGLVHPDFCIIGREWIMGRCMECKDGIYKLAQRGRDPIGA